MPNHIVFIQHGDYRETIYNFANGGEETYYAQKYSVDYVENLTTKHDKISVICIDLEPDYYEVLPSGVHSYGLKFYNKAGNQKLISLLENIKPTHIILRSPSILILSWAINHNIEIFPILADSFFITGLISWFKIRKLRNALNHPHIQYVSNHNIMACKNLINIGVKSSKIIPWDWPSFITPDSFPIREHITEENHIKLLYVGSITESKGVGDFIDAVALLTKTINKRITLDIFGAGSDSDLFIEKGKSLSMQDHIHFAGRIAHNEIFSNMMQHDIIVVPSRSSFPEGLPMVIYEALSLRIPIILSTHPMFISRFDNSEVMFFEQSNPKSLAEAIEKLISDPDLYRQLSINSKQAWERIQCPVKWVEMLENWLSDSEESKLWLNSYTFDNHDYNI